MYLLQRIERYLRRSGTPASRFGIDVARDPRLVFDFRNGRCPGESMAARVSAFLDRAERELSR